MKGMRASCGPSSVNHDDHETKLSHRLKPQRCSECFRDKEILWSGVDMLHDRILFSRIEIGRSPDQPIKIGDAIGGLALKRFGKFPAGTLQIADIGLFENPN